MSQQDKSFLSIAGEFLVASELNRRRIQAAVTYGASKTADVWAFDEVTRRAVRIEVKTTSTRNRKWVVGYKANVRIDWDLDTFWVLVHLPEPLPANSASDRRGQHAPVCYVLTSEEIGRIVSAKDDAYRTHFVARNRREPPLDKGVPSVLVADVQHFAEQWEKIQLRLGSE